MTKQLATIVVVPRERFSMTQRSLESILANTDPAVKLVYVDGGSPPQIRDYLRRKAAACGFRLIRTEHYLSPNAARNLGLTAVETSYAVFIDNDIVVSPGWLRPLVNCAEATGAWVVGAVYCEGEPIATKIHMAGGLARVETQNGRQTFSESHCHYGELLQDIGPTLQRRPVEQIEFHCALVSRAAFDRLGPLDEQLLTAAEHTDLCLLTRAAGAAVYLEPQSIVTYLPPPPFEPPDLAFFRWRWSHARNQATVERFRQKWNIAAGDPSLAQLLKWLNVHRRLALEPFRGVLRLMGRKPARVVEQVFLAPLEQVANRLQFPLRRDGAARISRRLMAH